MIYAYTNQNNWDSIVERLNGGHCGSCTEPLISHILSERLSRNPLAWSREGLSKMAMLRIFTENGGRVTAEHIRVSRSRKERAKDHNALRNGLEIYNLRYTINTPKSRLRKPSADITIGAPSRTSMRPPA